MPEFNPFITNDGSVGLYSNETQDVYHSAFGALTEAYEKFILPSSINEHLKNFDEIKILDICYGIGYNTKSFLNYFITQKYFQKNKNFSKKILSFTKNNGAIYTDNILQKIIWKFYNVNTNCISSIGSDNISELKTHKVLIHAIDSDKFLFGISPFIKNYSSEIYKCSADYINKYLNNKPHKNFEIRDEAALIIFLEMIKENPSIFDKENLDNIEEKIKDKNLAPFFDKFMVNFAQFYSNRGYNFKDKQNKSTFLHNIYYQYISNSYKNTLQILKNNDFHIKFINKDARVAVQKSALTYNYIFLDAFSPNLCPCLWSLDFFKQLYEHLDNNGELLTYSTSCAVRGAMKEAGFFIGKIFNEVENNFTGTIATKNKDLIKYPLNEFEEGLLHSKAGIFYRDETLSDKNDIIIKRREHDIETSDRISSSRYTKEHKR